MPGSPLQVKGYYTFNITMWEEKELFLTYRDLTLEAKAGLGPENLNEATFKDKELICLADGISTQNIQAVAWWLFTVFNQIYSERDQNVWQKDVIVKEDYWVHTC